MSRPVRHPTPDQRSGGLQVVVVDEHRFRAMGTDCHVLVVDGPPGACDLAEHLVRDDEARWSRFRPDSDVSRLAASAGRPVALAPETVALLQRALVARATTEGWFDPLLGAHIVAAGYDRSFPDLAGTTVPVGGVPAPPLAGTRSALVLDGASGTVPAGVAVDVGAIAKGHSADRAVAALLAAGAAGALVGIGGDVACAGDGPDGAGWWLDVDHGDGAPSPTGGPGPLGLLRGGVATSTTARRRWRTVDDDGVVGDAHHVLDPRTGRPAQTRVRAATVVAPDAATAEVLATVALLAPDDDVERLLREHHAAAVRTLADGTVDHLGPIGPHLHPEET